MNMHALDRKLDTKASWAASAVALILCFQTTTVHAGGTELTAAGTTALGRGGAVMSRPGEAMSLLYNPANLSTVQGMQLSLQTHLAFYRACLDREGTYGAYSEGTAQDSHGPSRISDSFVASADAESAFAGRDTSGELPEVCNSGPPGIVPELIFTWRPHRRVGMAFGLLAPAAVGHNIFGEDTTIGDRTYVGTVNGLPSPSRYNLVEEQLLIAFPTLGVGVELHPRVRVGAAFGWGIGSFSFVNATRALRGEEFAGDLMTELNAFDGFVPRITVSVSTTPIDNFDISASFMWTDTVKAGGDIKLTSGYYRTEPLEELTIHDAELVAPQPWQAAFGMRYGHRRTPRVDNAEASAAAADVIDDPMWNEYFDVEFNAVYEHNSSVDNYTVNFPNCAAGGGTSVRNGMSVDAPCTDSGAFQVLVPFLGFALPVPPSTVLPHQWQDSLSLRLGGDWNVVPGRIALRAGASYETKGAGDGYEQLDFVNLERVGGHLGFTLRFGRFDLGLGFAYITQNTATTTLADARLRQVNAEQRFAELAYDRCVASGMECGERDTYVEEHVTSGLGTIVNGGKVSSSASVLSLGLTYHFR